MSSRLYGMRRTVYVCAGALLCFNSLPHVMPGILRSQWELPNSTVPAELEAHVHRIAAAMGLPHSANTKVFISKGFSSISGGSAHLPLGAVIGLPRTVLYRSVDDATAVPMAMNGEHLDWASAEGQKLAQVMLHSPNEINFSIAHEVAHLKHRDACYGVGLSPVILVAGYHLAVSLLKYAFPRSVVAAFPLMMALTLVAYAQSSSSLSHWQEFRADRTAARCHRSYAEGGVELMKRRMQMDALLRMPSSKLSFEKVMASLSTHPPYGKRLQRLENILMLTDNR